MQSRSRCRSQCNCKEQSDNVPHWLHDDHKRLEYQLCKWISQFFLLNWSDTGSLTYVSEKIMTQSDTQTDSDNLFLRCSERSPGRLQNDLFRLLTRWRASLQSVVLATTSHKFLMRFNYSSQFDRIFPEKCPIWRVQEWIKDFTSATSKDGDRGLPPMSRLSVIGGIRGPARDDDIRGVGYPTGQISEITKIQ